MLNRGMKLYAKMFKQDIGVQLSFAITNIVIAICSFVYLLYSLNKYIQTPGGAGYFTGIFGLIVGINVNIILITTVVYYIVTLEKRFSNANGYIYTYLQLPLSRWWSGLYGYLETLLFLLVELLIYGFMLYFLTKFMVGVISKEAMDADFAIFTQILSPESIKVVLSTIFGDLYGVAISYTCVLSFITSCIVVMKKFRINGASSAIIATAVIVTFVIILIITGTFAQLPDEIYTIFANTYRATAFVVILNVFNYYMYKYKLDF